MRYASQFLLFLRPSFLYLLHLICYTFLPVYVALFSLALVPYHYKEYPTNSLCAIMEEHVFACEFTWNSKHNTASKKDRLPKKLQDAIMHVARAASKGTPGVTEKTLDAQYRNRFSSYYRNKKKKVNLPALTFRNFERPSCLNVIPSYVG